MFTWSWISISIPGQINLELEKWGKVYWVVMQRHRQSF